MWPFKESNAGTIVAKRDERERALATAGAPASSDLPSYFTASGGSSHYYLCIFAFSLMESLPTQATDIVSRIAAGKWSASEVLEAYIARSVFAHSKTNCLTEGAS